MKIILNPKFSTFTSARLFNIVFEIFDWQRFYSSFIYLDGHLKLKFLLCILPRKKRQFTSLGAYLRGIK